LMESKAEQQKATRTNLSNQQLALQLDQVRADTFVLSKFMPCTDAAALGPGVAIGAGAPAAGTYLHAEVHPAGAGTGSGMAAAGASTGGAAPPRCCPLCNSLRC
jgi:hypothetical protein